MANDYLRLVRTALNAILQSLSPGDTQTSIDGGSKLSAEQVRKISDKLGEILGHQADSADGPKRNEKGEVCPSVRGFRQV